MLPCETGVCVFRGRASARSLAGKGQLGRGLALSSFSLSEEQTLLDSIQII